MRVVTPQITWHNRDPVLCIDFDPTCNQNADGEKTEFYRLASGGSDSVVIVWHLKNSASVKVELVPVAELTRHAKAVNALRFSPCGNFLASADDEAYVYIWKIQAEKSKPDEEFWTVDKTLRKHIDDIADISWSLDSGRLATTSVDNSAIIWDVKKGTPLHIWSEHGGFVQGVSFDPLGDFVATVSTDRFLRMFNPQTGKLSVKTLKYPFKWLPKQKEKDTVISEASSTDENQNGLGQSKKSSTIICNRIFYDDTLKSFCRRLNFSPKGEFLIVPGGILPPNTRDAAEKSVNDPAQVPQAIGKTSGMEKPLSDRNAVIVFCRNSFSTPCSVLPTGTSYSIATRFCPIYFQRNRDVVLYSKDLTNPLKKSERLVTCVGRLKESKRGKQVMLDMPYRLVFAIGTNDSVIICDTDSVVPLAVVRNIHLTRISDLSWSADGKLLIASSTDGYCSIISFEESELGVPLPQEGVVSPSPQAFPVPPPPPPKEKPLKVKTPKSAKKPIGKELSEKEQRNSTKLVTPTTPPSSKRDPNLQKTSSTMDIAKYFKSNKAGKSPIACASEDKNLNNREKRPATSPLSSLQKPKQPRRVEFITLPSSPIKDD